MIYEFGCCLVLVSQISVICSLSFAYSYIDIYSEQGEPRQATASSVYFSLLAFLYVWLASVTILTVLPQFSTNYNIIIAAALFFYMVFVSICSLLAGRFIIRGLYYVWIFWKNGSRAAIEARMLEVISTVSFGMWETQSINGKVSDETIQPLKEDPFPVLVAFQRPFRRVFRSAVMLSGGLCILYSHCWSRSLSAFTLLRDEGASIVCRGVFVPMLIFGSESQTDGFNTCHGNNTCADERSIWILWAAMIIGHLFYYAMHEFAGKHHTCVVISKTHSQDFADMEVSKSSSSLDMDLPFNGVDSKEFDEGSGDEDENHTEKHPRAIQTISAKIQKLRMKQEQPEDTLPMVSWYSNIIFSTGFDMLLSFKVFLGRFDARKMQVALLHESSRENAQRPNNSTDPYPEGIFDFSHCKYDSGGNSDPENAGFWFDFISDCGDGFNSSYQMSRLVAQPTLSVFTPSNHRTGRRSLPRGNLLINGGDLAYPDPTPENYEERFFRTFEDALPPPPSYRKEHISIQKPASELSSYQGPCAFLSKCKLCVHLDNHHSLY